MQPLLSNWTIVIVGRWNIDILTPDWVGANIFSADAIDLEMAFDGMQMNMKYSLNGVSFFPKAGRVIISVENTEDRTLQAAEDVAIRLLEALPITPINAVGVNYTYLESEVPIQLARAFTIGDTSSLTDFGFEIANTEVSRRLVSEGEVLNLKLTKLDDGQIRAACNFHGDASSAVEAVAVLRDKVLLQRRRAEEILGTVYELSLEENNEQ